jgi:hypothetical protein
MEQEIRCCRICMSMLCAHKWQFNITICAQVYGTAPNDFLAAAVAGRSVGKVFSIGEGEGRNACFLASLPGSEGDSSGHRVLSSCCDIHVPAVHSIDASEVGVAKTLKLASQRGVSVHASQGITALPLPAG